MRTLLGIKIKEQFLKKRNLVMLLIIPLVITYICTYIDNEARDNSKVYNVAIIDHDVTELSSSLVKKMGEYSEIELSIEEELGESLRKLARGKYDVVYEIKEGFQRKIQNGEFDDTLTAHKEINSTTVKWLNDQMSLMVVKEWLYVDVLDIIHSLDIDLSEEDFKQKFEESMANNRILTLDIEKINEGEDNFKVDETSKAWTSFKILWASIIIFIIISFGKRVVDDRERGIITRLELSGLSKIKYYTVNIITQILCIIIPFIVSFFMLSYFTSERTTGFFFNLVITTFYIMFIWVLVILIGHIFNSKRNYNFASQAFLLVSIIFGTGFFSGTIKLIDYVSWLLPIKWYMHFKV